MKRIAAVVGMVLGMTAGAAQAVPSNVFAFGDSLIDTGNVYLATSGATPPAPYYNGRFSNGPLFGEIISASYGITLTPSLISGNNFSWGGAQTGTGYSSSIPNVQTQISAFLLSRSGVADPNALYIIEGGGNDVLPAATSGNIPAAIAGVVNNIATEILTLAGSGAKNFLVVNVPDVGATPRVLTDYPLYAPGATTISVAINQGLLQALMAIQYGNPSLNLQLLDLFGIGTMVGANPSAFGFTDTNAPCFTGTSLCANPDQYLYWDSFHPTAAVGRLVAAIYLPEPSTLLLLLLPLAGVGIARRKAARKSS